MHGYRDASKGASRLPERLSSGLQSKREQALRSAPSPSHAEQAFFLMKSGEAARIFKPNNTKN